MIFKEEIKEMIKKHEKLDVIARCISNLNDTEFIELIKGFYEMSCDYTTSLIRHNGDLFPNKTVYHIRYYKRNDKESTVRAISGFCAALIRTLRELFFSDFFHLIPVVEWGNTSPYYDSEMDSVTENVFEYYFEPVSGIDYREVANCRNVVEARAGHAAFFTKHVNSYKTELDEIEKLGNIYKKYIRLNRKTEEYIKENLKSILNNRAVLAVHVRGTDFSLGTKDHPILISAEEYLAEVKKLYSSGRYEKVFLATEDENILKLFQRELKDDLLYYTDVFRTQDHLGPQLTSSGRPLHHYKLGLEVLRDVYTLANCDSLVCGVSQVSIAARYVKLALGQNFRETVLLDRGINKENSAEARKFQHQRKDSR